MTKRRRDGAGMPHTAISPRTRWPRRDRTASGLSHAGTELAFEEGDDGLEDLAALRVQAVEPRAELLRLGEEPRAHDLLRHYENKILLGEVGRPRDCAGAVVFLCSEAARYLTGEIIVIDGGLTVCQIGKMTAQP